MTPLRVALTGSPGTGKTTLSAEGRRHGWQVVDVAALARALGLVVGRDELDAADVIDTDALAAAIRDPGWRPRTPGTPGTPADTLAAGNGFLFEGHLSHFLPLDAVWVVRCDPDVLRGRLEGRGYAPSKVQENLEAEALDLILQEALDSGMPVVQRDGTRRTPEALWKAFVEATSADLKDHDLEPVDWSDRLPIP